MDTGNDRDAGPKADGEQRPGRSGQRLGLIAVKPRAPTSAQQVENCLSNPFAVVRLAMGARTHGHGPRGGNVAFPDKTLLNLKETLDGAFSKLDQLTEELAKEKADRVAFELRVNARETITKLREWVILTVIERSGTDDATTELPLFVPESVVDQLKLLARAGRSLAHTWHEIAASTNAKPAPGDKSSPLREAPAAAFKARHATERAVLDFILEQPPFITFAHKDVWRGIKGKNVRVGLDRVQRIVAKLRKEELVQTHPGKGIWHEWAPRRAAGNSESP